ncbi:twin-arginine translocation pathway signal [Mycobacterium sp. NPDC051198]
MTLNKDTGAAEESSTAKVEDDDRDVAEADAVETAVDMSGDEDGDATEPNAEPSESDAQGNRLLGALKSRLVPIMLGVALVASAALASAVYFALYRPDQETGTKAAELVVQAASDGTVALLSYAPDSLDQDFTNAKSHLTGDFLSYYTDFTTKIVKPAAGQKKVKTNAKVVQGAAVEVKPESADVLLFINQTTTSQEIPDGSYSVSAVKVGLSKIDGNWLISSFDPV